MSDPNYTHIGSIYVRIAEEAAEVAHAALTCERFGAASQHPETGKVNWEMLVEEMHDLLVRYREWKACLDEVARNE